MFRLPPARFILPPLMLALLLSSPACEDNQSCDDGLTKIARCNRMFRENPCVDTRGTCQVACLAKLPCDQFDALDRGDVPEWLNRCYAKCENTFTCADGSSIDGAWGCDGAADCADGSDEGNSCRYHRCAN